MRRSAQEAVKEEKTPGGGSPAKEFTTKAEYNRWLVAQHNAAAADAVRAQSKAGDEFVKGREREHQTKGLARQQAAVVQMKRASESIEAHREANLSRGRVVNEQVVTWRTGYKETRSEWASYGKSIKEAQRASNATAESVAALSASKKAQAQATRDDDAKKEKARKDLQDAYQEQAKRIAERVKAETADAVVDEAKRVFYEQRLKSANDTKADAARLEKARKEDDVAFLELQKKRRVKSKAYRAAAGKSKAALLTARAEEASAIRDEKRRLAETARQRLEDEKRERTAQVRRAARASAPGRLRYLGPSRLRAQRS